MNPTDFARQMSRLAHKSLSGVGVQIERDGSLSDILVCTVGYSKSFEDDLELIRAEYRQRDFLIDVSDYTVNGQQVEPEIGDLIYQTVNGDRLAFEVEPYNNEFVAIHTDTTRKIWRVHTKEVYYDA